MKLQLIRNATLLMHYAGYHILIDPYFAPKHSHPSFSGKSPNPTVDLPLNPEQILEGVQLVIVSHLHSDHFDGIAHELVPKQLPLFCQPGDEDTIQSKGFQDVIPIPDQVIWHGIRITRTVGHHGTGEVETIMGNVSGFIFEAEGEPTLYWVGDTILCDEVRSVISTFQPPIIVTHSCGATWADGEGNRSLIVMDDIQTVQMCRLAPESIVIAVHMEALDHATISRADLRSTAERMKLDADKLLIPSDGEVIEI